MHRFTFASTLVVATIASLPSIAHAHFVLVEPPSWQMQGLAGDPQKEAPCGDPGVRTNTVTRFHAGDTIHFAFNEMIPHTGHYRVALGLRGQIDLPADPTVMLDAGRNSIGVPIQNPAVFPVLADGLLPHNAGDIQVGHMYTADVRLPANMTCDQCFLQITQYMNDHGSNTPTTNFNGGFFYHHCAAIAILPAGAPLDGGLSVTDAGATADARPADGNPSPADAPRDTGGGGGASGGTGGSGGSGGTSGSGGTGGSSGSAGTIGSGGQGGGAGGTSGGAGGTATGGTGGTKPATKSSSGCAVAGGSPGGLVMLFIAAALLVRRRGRTLRR
jgi:MYXO-CTERM domain-containing protein